MGETLDKLMTRVNTLGLSISEMIYFDYFWIKFVTIDYDVIIDSDASLDYDVTVDYDVMID